MEFGEGGGADHKEHLRPPLIEKLFPVNRPSGLKRADWNFFFIIFEEKKKKTHFFSVNEKNILKNPDLPTGYFLHPVDRKLFIILGWPDDSLCSIDPFSFIIGTRADIFSSNSCYCIMGIMKSRVCVVIFHLIKTCRTAARVDQL